MHLFSSRTFDCALAKAALLLAGLFGCGTAVYGQAVTPGKDPPIVLPADPSLRIGGPVFVPSAVSPSASLTDVTVGATVAGGEILPSVLFLEEVTSTGRLLDVVAELKDDGAGLDKQAGDGRYMSPALQFGNASESERYFRIRAGNDNANLRTRIVTFAVTNLPIGFPTSDPARTVPTPDGLDRAFTNQVVFTTETAVGPRQVREIVAEVSAELNANAEIVGFVPRLNGYRVKFDGEATYDAIVRVAEALEGRVEIAHATPTHAGRPFADWWLQKANVVALRENKTVPSPVPILGSPDIGVAVIELGPTAGVDCAGATGLTCMPASAIASIPGGACAGLYASSTNSHGTKVANLLAEDATLPGILDEGGVAPNIRLLPLRASSSTDTASVLNCIEAYNNVPGTNKIHIVNISYGANLVGVEATLKDAICDLACDNVLMVAAAGNNACGSTTLPHPGKFGDSTENCSCGSSPRIGDFMLRVGATTDTDALGNNCGGDPNWKSHAGDIYAPGWGIPGPPREIGTSYAAPLVSGCAAVRAAVDVWGGGAAAWNASDTESRLRGTANSIGLTGGGLLDCHAAVQDPYDIVFLLDRSGSMNVPPGASSRWAALKPAVDGFTEILETSAPGSRFGLTLFSSGLSEPMGSGMVNIGPGLQTTVNGHLNLTTPSGSTGMGPGLKNAIAKLGSAGRPRVVVLFTDGDQNVPFPTVGVSGCDYDPYVDEDMTSVGTSPIDLGCPGSSASGSVKIIPVGVNSPSSTYLTTLQALATQHRGTLLVVNSTGTGFVAPASISSSCTGSIEAAFDCAVAPALYGSSLQMVASTLTPLLQNEDLLKFAINRDIARLVIKISASQSNGLDFRRLQNRIRVFKDGVDVSRYFNMTIGASPNSLLLTTNLFSPPETIGLPDMPSHGEYTITLSPDDVGLEGGQQAHTVRIVVFADDHRLDMRWELSPTMPRAGQMLTPRVRLRWAGQPVIDAHVIARIHKPGDDLGHVLALHPVSVDLATGIDAQSPGWQKFEYLLRTDAAFRAQLAANENVLELDHEGDGWYAASFNPGDVSGTYQIAYEVTAESEEYGVIEREAAQSAYVRFGEIDLKNSLISRAVDGNTITLTLKPVTATGRLVGPGQASVFGVDGVDGVEAKIVDVADHQDGSYTLVLSADPKSTIEFSVLGDVIHQGRADFDQPGLGNRWLFPILLLLFLLLVVGVLNSTERS